MALSICRFLPLSLLVLLGACGDDHSGYDTSLLPGRWEIAEAYRNDAPTTSLESLYFVFGEEDALRTNIAGMDQDLTYQLEGAQIIQMGGSLNPTYQIKELTPDRLVLTTTLRNYDFRFVLNKATEAE